MGNTRSTGNRAPLRDHPAPATTEGYERISPPRFSRRLDSWICELHYGTGAVCEVRYPDERSAWIDYDVRRERLRAADTSPNAHLRRRIRARQILRAYQRGLLERLSPEEQGILEAITPAPVRFPGQGHGRGARSGVRQAKAEGPAAGRVKQGRR